MAKSLHPHMLKLAISVLATVIGGVILVQILQEPERPDIKVVKNVMAADEGGYSVLEITLHNDGPVSVGNCVAVLEGRYANGTRTTSYPGSIGYFYVPANGDAVYPDSARSAIRFHFKREKAPGGRMNVVVLCDGYSTELTVEKDVVPTS